LEVLELADKIDTASGFERTSSGRNGLDDLEEFPED